MKLAIYFVLFSFLVTAHVTSGAEYKLLYHQGADSKEISGSIEALKAAVREGKRLRLYMNLGFVEHSMDAGFVSIFEDKVYAQINTIQAQRPNRKTKKIELREDRKHTGLYSTESLYEIKWYSF